MAEKLRIRARPDGMGWIDYYYNGNIVGASKDRRDGEVLSKTGTLKNFIRHNNLQAPTKPL